MSFQDTIAPPADTADPGQWHTVARHWAQVGPPLRPSRRDVQFATTAVLDWSRAHGAPRALIQGVTPELHDLPWPEGTDLVAIDHTQAMIDHVWPGRPEQAICAEWTDMPLDDASRDIVLCDGGDILMSYPDAHRAWAREMTRVIPPDGIAILRLFAPPTRQEDPDEVMAEFLRGEIANLNLLKLRLGMAMQDSLAAGTPIHDMWAAVHAAEPDFDKLARRVGWPVEHLRAIEAYRGRPARYHYLSVPDVEALFCDTAGAFTLESLQWPDYELGDRCPTLMLRRR